MPDSRRLLKVLCAVLFILLSISSLSYAQSATTFYLHGTGADANPPTLFLNTTAPTSSAAKYKDSTSVNFSGGNLWKEVGTWPSNPVPPAGTLTALSPLHVWLGLQNSDDQGTNFDVRAEISKNGTVVAAGQTLCITGITRNPANALEATVSFGSFDPVTFDGTSDGLSLKILTRIGTNPDGTKCAGHNSAVGLRLYFDATSRISKFGATVQNSVPTQLSPDPLAINVGATGILTATLSPTPNTSGTLTATSSAPNVATVPASISFNAGQDTVSVPVTAVSTGSALITVSLNGGSATSTVQVTPAPPTITSLSPDTLSITQGGSGILTVTISSAQTTNTSIAVSSSSPQVAFVPSSVTVPAGQLDASITVSANSPGNTQISASLNGTSTTSTVTVTPAAPTVISLLPPTNPVTLGATTELTVTISAAQPTDTIISVSASPGGIITVPASVTVPAGQTATQIPVGTSALGTATVQASLNGTSAEAAVQVVPPPPALVSLLPSDLSIVVGATGTFTVTLNAAQQTNTVVSLSVDNANLLMIPSSVTVPAGEMNASFTVTGLAQGNTVITASLNGSSQTSTIHIIPPPPAVVSLLPNPLSIQQGATGTFTLTINAAQPSDTVIPLANSASTILQTPNSATVPAGETSTTFSVLGLSPGSATLTASINATTVSATVQVTPPPTIVTGLTPSTLSLPKGRPGVLHVAVSPASPQPQIVTLMSSNATVAQVPDTVTIPAGELGADFPVLSIAQGQATITATLGSGSASAVVTVTPAELSTINVSPDAPTLSVGETLAFTATGTYTDGTTQNMTANVTWNSSNQSIAMIDTTGLASAIAPGTTTITATSGPISGSTLLTVPVPPPPVISGFSPTSGLIGTVVILTGQNFIPNLTGNTVRFNGVPAQVTQATSTTLTTIVPSGATTGPITVTTIGGTATSAQNFYVILPPTITSFSPTSGPVGTAVTLTGTNFNSFTPSDNRVSFNGKPAIISSVTSTTIQTLVPLGATTGPITLTNSAGTATTAQPFTVTLSSDYQLSIAPSSVTAVQGQSATAIIQMTGSDGFSNLVDLTISGLPAGVTASFSTPVISLYQSVTLTLTTSGTTPAGISNITLTGTTTIDGQSVSRTATLSLEVLASGNTTLSGRVLREQDDVPLEGVTLKIGTQTTRTDASGRFLFIGPPTGDQIMIIDGSTVTNPAGVYHTLPAQVNIVPNQANELSFISYLPAVDTSKVSTINPSQDSSIQDPRIPGFSLNIPAGTELRSDFDGSLITQVAITPVSPDRIPLFPPPATAPHIDPNTIYLLYFFKPGGAIPTQPITQFTIPNDLNLKPGDPVEFYYFDSSPTLNPDSNQWKRAGMGKISPDGKVAVPDPGVGFPKFCCAQIFVCRAIPIGIANLGAGGVTGGEPVDLATGQFVLDQTDLILPGRIPLVIQRHYQTGRAIFPGTFGRGTSFNYEQEMASIGGAFVYVQANGREDILSGQPDGTYQNTALPFLRSLVLTVNEDGTKTLRKKDGTVERYNSQGRLIALEDRNGNAVTIERDSGGRIIRIIEPAGRALTVGYDSQGRIASITDPISRPVQYTYNADGFLETVANSAGGVTRYTYDTTGRVLTITDARGITYLQNEYDTRGRVVRQTMADGGVWTSAYGTFGETITEARVTDPRGNTTTHRFNRAKYPAETIDALGQRTRNDYDFATNLLLSTRDPLNRITRFTYDLSGNVTSILDPAGNVTLMEYEPTFNRLTKLTDALGHITTFEYDALGNLIKTTDPLSNSTTIAYNEFGQPISVTDPLNNTTTFEYDAVGNLVTTTDPLGNKTQRTYDAVSRLIALTDPNGKTTQFAYDPLNRVTQITDAIAGLTQFTYDPNGNLLTVTDAKNQTTTYTYDNMDRLATRKDALNRQESYQYDQAGNLTQFTDRKNQQTTFQYDALNRRTQATYSDATTTFTYDSMGRLIQASDSAPGAGAIEFVYDVLDRLVQETTGQGTVAYQYDVLGRRTQMTANGQQPVSYQYDAASRLTQVAQGSQVVGLGYDEAGRRTSLTYPNGTSTSYSYDTASRLTNILHQGPTALIESLSYSYDAAGNRISFTRGNNTTTLLPDVVQAAYDAANEQIQFNNSTPNLTYDSNGNLTSQTDTTGTTTYMWDARNRLIAISSPGISASFVYDVLGRRVSKTINGTTTQYQYDDNDIIAEIGGGAMGATYLRSLNIDEPFIRQSSMNEYYHTDALASVLGLTDQAGSILNTYRYDPFGNTQSTNSAFSNSFQYTGRENDGTGLYYYRARYYNPALQRFISEDPIGMFGGMNFYSYIKNSPFDSTDPLGLFPDSVRMAIFSMMARGDVQGALALATSAGIKVNRLEQLIERMTTLMQKYPPTSFKCDILADKIFKAFRGAGANPQIINITDKFGALYFRNAQGQLFSERGLHQVVRVGDTVYDAFTGPMGMELTQYMNMLRGFGIEPVF